MVTKIDTRGAGILQGSARKHQELDIASKKTVIETGAAQGIGAAVVQAFLGRGYNVVATSRSVSKVSLAPSRNLALVHGDIGQAATAEKVVQAASVGNRRCEPSPWDADSTRCHF